MTLNKNQILSVLFGLSITAILMSFMKKSFDELVFITTFGVIVTGIIAINFEE